jgi:hypothetical protein
MIEVSMKRMTYERIKLTDEEAMDVAKQYLEKNVLGGNYINKEGFLEDWDAAPHGSGTTTTYGAPSPLQKAAWDFLIELGKRPKAA